MNKLSTLLASSLLTISSVAAAQSGVEFHAGASIHVSLGTSHPAPAPLPAPVIVRDHRDQPSPLWRPVMALAHPMPVRATVPASAPWIELGSVSTGQQTLRPGNRKLDSLRLEVDGRVTLDKVVIYYADRTQAQVVQLDTTLTDRMPMPVIELAGNDRLIKKIVVFSTAARRGTTIKIAGRNDARRPAPAPATGWARLGAVSTGTQVLRISDTTRFDALAFKATGKVHLEKAVIKFGNGDTQVVAFDTTLTSASTSPMIDLQGTDRRIVSIVVFSDDQLRGELTVFGI